MNNFVNILTYKTNKEHIINLKKMGVKYVFKKNKVKLYFGVAFLIIAFLPNGLFVPSSLIGFMLLGINKVDLFNYKVKQLRILLKNKKQVMTMGIKK